MPLAAACMTAMTLTHATRASLSVRTALPSRLKERHMPDPKLDDLCVNTIRTLAIDAVEKAQSGHAGAPMGAGLMAYVLWDRFLKHNPADPKWRDRDRFVLSAGHASLLHERLLPLAVNRRIRMDDLKHLRLW